MTWSLGAGKCRLQAAQEAEFSACCRWNSRVWGEAEPGDVGVTTLLSFSRGQERDVRHSHGYLAADSVEESEIWEVNCSRCNCLIAAAGGLVSEAVKKGMVQLAFCWILSFSSKFFPAMGLLVDLGHDVHPVFTGPAHLLGVQLSYDPQSQQSGNQKELLVMRPGILNPLNNI